jgi:hypothetical protein
LPRTKIGEYLGRRDLAVTANTYAHMLVDDAELDVPALLASAG